jgi:hypothetical protein
MKLYQFILIALILLLISSCGRKEYTEKGILELKKEIDSLLHNPEAEEHFNWGSAEAYSNFRAYFNNSKLIFINEDYHYRKGGDKFNLYYFKDRNVLYYIGRELTYMPKKQSISLEMMIDPDGNMISYEYVANGQKTSLSGEESNLIIEHARALEKIVSESSSIISK